MNAGMAAVALKVGGYKTMNNSSKHLKHVMLLMREMMPLIKVKGGKPSFADGLLMLLPAGITGFVMQKMMKKMSLARYVMDSLEESGHATYEFTSDYPRDVLKDARKLGVSLPRLEALESSFH